MPAALETTKHKICTCERYCQGQKEVAAVLSQPGTSIRSIECRRLSCPCSSLLECLVTKEEKGCHCSPARTVRHPLRVVH
ncbi:hypothetical protein K439DRAFT_1637783 [Ramaria rubella]|nr:hypothetical protein K439DRAFT_1637783 [Ramaria rubella]